MDSSPRTSKIGGGEEFFELSTVSSVLPLGRGKVFKVPLQGLNGAQFHQEMGRRKILTPLGFLKEMLWLLLWLDDLELDFSLSLTGTENGRFSLVSNPLWNT